MDIDADSVPVRNNEADGAFEIEIDGHVALLQYFRRGSDTIVYPHTLVPPELEGHGLAARLAKHALEYARANGLRVVPRCPYVRAYLERHPEYQDLVAAEG
jgi:uncharacterized protein